MKKLYVLSEHPDKEVEQVIHDLSENRLRVALYGIARGWEFDEAVAIAKNIISLDDVDASSNPDILVVIRDGVLESVRVRKEWMGAKVELIDYDSQEFPDDLTEEEENDYDPFAVAQNREDELAKTMPEVF